MAVSFSLVDPKFLVQQTFSLTLQPVRPALAKVNETYEQYRHYNALVIVLLVRKIPKMKFLLSCTSSQQDLRRLRKYYRLEVQLAYLVYFAQMLLRFASHLIFSALQISLTLLFQSYTHVFKNKFTFIYFNLALYPSWQDLKGLIKQYRQEVQLAYLVDFAQFLSRFSPHSTFLHSKLQSYTSWNHFYKRMFAFIFVLIWSCTCSWQDPSWPRKATGLRYSLHIQSPLPNFYFGLLHILLFGTLNLSYTPWNHELIYNASCTSCIF